MNLNNTKKHTKVKLVNYYNNFKARINDYKIKSKNLDSYRKNSLQSKMILSRLRRQ